MRRLFLGTLLLAVAFPAVSPAAPSVARLSVVAWASTATKTAIPPEDAVSGGTYCTRRAIRRLFAFVRFSGMRDKTPSSATWFFNGKRAYRYTFKWEDGEAGRTAFSLFRTKGTLVEGTYKIEVRTAGRMLDSGSIKLRFGSCPRG